MGCRSISSPPRCNVYCSGESQLPLEGQKTKPGPGGFGHRFCGARSLGVPVAINYRYITFLACTAALGGLLFGFDIAIITGAGPFILRAFGSATWGWAGRSVRCCSAAWWGRSLPEGLPIVTAAGDCSSWSRSFLRLPQSPRRRPALHLFCGGALHGRTGRGRRVAALAHVRLRGVSALHPRPAGRHVPDVDRVGNPHLLRHQLPAAQHRPGQLAMDVPYRRSAVGDLSCICADGAGIAALPRPRRQATRPRL